MSENMDCLIFDKSMPTDLGIPTEAVLSFLEDLEADGFCMHGVLMAKEGRVFTEAYYAPFTKDTPHRMYSVGKSFTSVAIGLLQEEGKLHLRDCICDYFPDKVLEHKVHPYLLKTTIQDMLRMATPHSNTTYKQVEDKDWVKTFFEVTPSHYPGSCFCYDTSSTHVLSALVERLSGKTLLEYLQGKVFRHLDCSNAMKFIKDPMGISQGGSGLICTMRDLAKFAYTCMKEGRYKGKQLIPRDYIKEATSYQISTCLQSTTEERQGYGYQFWRCRNNAFSLYGMGGQLALCIPDKDFLLVTQADNLSNPNGVQGIYDAFWHHIYPYLCQTPKLEDIQEKYTSKIANLCIKPLQGNYSLNFIRDYQKKIYSFESNQTGTCECFFTFDEEKQEGCFCYSIESGKQEIYFGLGHMVTQQFPNTKYCCCSSATLVEKNVLYLRSYVIDEVYASLNVTITWIENIITLHMKRTSEPFLQFYEGCITGVSTN